jgi:hypothetical protein
MHRHEMQQSNIYLGIYIIEYYFFWKNQGVTSSNPEEYIEVYHMVIEATGDDDQVKTNYLSMALSSTARSWLVNLPEGTIYN